MRQTFIDGRRLGVLAGIAIVTIAAAAPASAESVVAAPGLENVGGNSNTNVPFRRTGTLRYQQLYSASSFASLTDPILISQLVFRQDEVGTASPFSYTIPDVQIELSTTSKTESTFSSTWANNVGADHQTVFDGALSLSSAASGGAFSTTPRPFDIVIDLDTPFLYDPSAGNLLMDVKILQGLTTSPASVQFDAFFTPGSGFANQNGSLTTSGGNGVSRGGGIVTEFNYAPAAVSAAAPEPGSGALAGALLFPLGILGRRYGRRKEAEA